MGDCRPRVPLSGIWSNLYAANLQDSLYWASEPSQFWDRWAQDQASRGRCWGFLEGAGYAATGVAGAWWAGLWESMETGVKVQGSPFPKRHSTFPFLDCADKEQVPLLKIEEPPTGAGRIAEFFTDLLTRRPLAQATHNFLRGLHFHKDYFHDPYFSTWKGIFSPWSQLSKVCPWPPEPWVSGPDIDTLRPLGCKLLELSLLGCLDQQAFFPLLILGTRAPLGGGVVLGSGRATPAGELRDQRQSWLLPAARS